MMKLKAFALIPAVAVVLCVASTASAQRTIYITVRPGDHLWGIGQVHGAGANEMLEANEHLKNPDVVTPNQQVALPANPSNRCLEVIRLTNIERARNGLPPLKESWQLSRAARTKAVDMATKGYFGHTSPTYGSPFAMMKQFGISYTAAAENIAQGQQNPQAVVTSWMNSPGHRQNILSPTYTQIGIGFDAHGNNWVQMFIKP